MDSVALLIRRSVARGWTSAFRGRGSGLSLWALVGVAFVAQACLLLFLGMQGADAVLRTDAVFHLEIAPLTTDRGIEEFLIGLRALPYVSSLDYVTREQAYENERLAHPDVIQFYEQAGIQNPFPDTVAVTVRSLSDSALLTAFLQRQDWRSTVAPASLAQAVDQQQRTERILVLLGAASAVDVILLAVVGLALLVTVAEFVRRRALLRLDEMFVARIGGAQESFVILPFAAEVAVFLVAAFAASVACLCLFLFAMPALAPVFAADGALSSLFGAVGNLLRAYGPVIAVAEVLCVLAFAYAGAWLGTRGREWMPASV